MRDPRGQGRAQRVEPARPRPAPGPRAITDRDRGHTGPEERDVDRLVVEAGFGRGGLLLFRAICAALLGLLARAAHAAAATGQGEPATAHGELQQRESRDENADGLHRLRARVVRCERLNCAVAGDHIARAGARGGRRVSACGPRTRLPPLLGARPSASRQPRRDQRRGDLRIAGAGCGGRGRRRRGSRGRRRRTLARGGRRWWVAVGDLVRDRPARLVADAVGAAHEKLATPRRRRVDLAPLGDRSLTTRDGGAVLRVAAGVPRDDALTARVRRALTWRDHLDDRRSAISRLGHDPHPVARGKRHRDAVAGLVVAVARVVDGDPSPEQRNRAGDQRGDPADTAGRAPERDRQQLVAVE